MRCSRPIAETVGATSTYRKSARNFNPTMAMAADLSIVQVRRIVELGELDPEMIVTPGIFIDRLVEVPG